MDEKANIVTVLGFDYGIKRIGVAVGQVVTATANPLTIVKSKNKKPDWSQINRLIQDWQPDALIVGMPKHADGSQSESSLAAEKFSRQLAQRYNLPIYTIDETLSSVAAEDIMYAQGTSKNTSSAIDDIAAQIILETWFSEWL